MLTAYTSFVAVHEKVRNTAEPARDVTQPQPLPQHVSDLAVGGRKVPEPGLGLLLALTGLIALVVKRPRTWPSR
jgi:Ca-activated chloride channel family protein